ncbi:putative peptidase S8 family protein [Lyophyllum shimeji]|uniref:Peptidase S8 family protein n=1 Tax=Lyophyllum shimeji TaxID=47721 RepID=A0A9P3UUF7_LYOSH|nr:putative peptidase S8 family protein [Lyophyllum shimeji]
MSNAPKQSKMDDQTAPLKAPQGPGVIKISISTMKFFTAVLAATVFVLSVLASPAPLHAVQEYKGAKTGKYIVKLKHGVSKEAIFGQFKIANITGEWTLFNAFASHLSAEALKSLRASCDVEYIAEDGIAHTSVTQINAPWGLEHISHTGVSNYSPNTLNHYYTYNEPAGAGVDIYIVDTGIQISHNQFFPRARWGATFGEGWPDADDNGHGTHVAGIAAGTVFGVAKDARLIAVKVLSNKGSGSISGIISGLNWVANAVRGSGKPSVVNLSMEGSASQPFDDTVTALVNRGIHVAVAAGNHNVDAKDTSPARAPGTNTVAASSIFDIKASFSNYGAVVNFWAPGVDIISAWIGANNVSHPHFAWNSFAHTLVPT